MTHDNPYDQASSNRADENRRQALQEGAEEAENERRQLQKPTTSTKEHNQMGNKYSVLVVKTGEIEIDADAALKYCHDELTREQCQEVGTNELDIVNRYAHDQEGIDFELCFDREIHVVPVETVEAVDGPELQALSRAELAAIESLVTKGYALAILGPEDLHGVSPDVIEDLMADRGAEAVATLKGVG